MYLNFRNFDMNIIQRTEPRDLYIATVLYFRCKQYCYLVYLRIELFLQGSLTEKLIPNPTSVERRNLTKLFETGKKGW